MTNNKVLHQFIVKPYVNIVFIGCILGLSVGYYLLLSEEFVDKPDTIVFLLFAILGSIVVFISWKLTLILDRMFSWKKQIENRFFFGLLLHFITTFIVCVFCLYTYNVVFKTTLNFWETFFLLLIKLGILVLILAILFQVIYFALYSYNSYVKEQIAEVSQERKQIEYQLSALKSQLSPHFLFNGLNTISSLTHSDTDKAIVFIRKLASMYNFTLNSYREKLIYLREELDFLTSYHYLMKTRFGEKYQYTIEIQKEIMETKIPPLSLQILAENAIKHNTMHKEMPLVVDVFIEEDYIIVRNNITKVPEGVQSFHIGLQNIKERYYLITGKKVIVVEEKDFLVKLPIIQ